MPKSNIRPTATTDPADRREALLDEALQETFPASDPIAVSPHGTGPAGVRTRPMPKEGFHSTKGRICNKIRSLRPKLRFRLTKTNCVSQER